MRIDIARTLWESKEETRHSSTLNEEANKYFYTYIPCKSSVFRESVSNYLKCNNAIDSNRYESRKLWIFPIIFVPYGNLWCQSRRNLLTIQIVISVLNPPQWTRILLLFTTNLLNELIAGIIRGRIIIQLIVKLHTLLSTSIFSKVNVPAYRHEKRVIFIREIPSEDLVYTFATHLPRLINYPMHSRQLFKRQLCISNSHCANGLCTHSSSPGINHTIERLPYEESCIMWQRESVPRDKSRMALALREQASIRAL